MDRIPELSAYATVGEVRDAIEQQRTRAKQLALRKRDPLESGVGLVQLAIRSHPGEMTKVELDARPEEVPSPDPCREHPCTARALEAALKSQEDKNDDAGASHWHLQVLDGIVSFVMQ